MPDPSQVTGSLNRICASRSFAASDRGRNFLTYIVNETLAGRSDRIKAYSIATQVFGRDQTFDAQNDPIVRVEAGRVRRALEHYYLTEGSSDALQIRIDKGGYIPTFVPVSDTVARRFAASTSGSAEQTWARESQLRPTATDRGATSPGIPGVTVSLFEDLTGSNASQIIARGLTEEVILKLARFREIRVYAETTNVRQADDTRPRTRYHLTGSIIATADRVHLAIRFRSNLDGSILWANAYDEPLETHRVVDLVRNVAGAVATTLAQAHGIISQAELALATLVPPSDWEAYQSTLAYYLYQDEPTEQLHATVRDGLKETVRRFPNYATAWALLSLCLMDEVRFRFPSAPGASGPIEGALEAARRAIGIDGQNARALHALMMALYMSGDVEESLATGERARQLNPNDTYLLAEYGHRVGLAGNWAAGSAMIAEALARNSTPLRFFQIGVALGAYFRGDYKLAAVHIERTGMQANPQVHFVMAAIYGQLGDIDRAARSRRWLEANAPHFVAEIASVVTSRFLRPEDQSRAFEGLRKAGIAVPD
jgi:TolB-like protein